MSSELIRTFEALAIIGASAPTLYRAAAAAGIKPAFRDQTAQGRPAYWHRSEIEELAAQRRGGGRHA